MALSIASSSPEVCLCMFLVYISLVYTKAGFQLVYMRPVLIFSGVYIYRTHFLGRFKLGKGGLVYANA